MSLNRRSIISCTLALLACVFILGTTSSCARMDKREARYDEKQCPFCTVSPGKCSYCEGTKKCSFCKGTGKRKTVSPSIPEENIKAGSYEEPCPYCKATGACHYCNGSGICKVCKGKATIENWDFYNESKKAAN